jgi:hypothetical protein
MDREASKKYIFSKNHAINICDNFSLQHKENIKQTIKSVLMQTQQSQSLINTAKQKMYL